MDLFDGYLTPITIYYIIHVLADEKGSMENFSKLNDSVNAVKMTVGDDGTTNNIAIECYEIMIIRLRFGQWSSRNFIEFRQRTHIREGKVPTVFRISIVICLIINKHYSHIIFTSFDII